MPQPFCGCHSLQPKHLLHANQHLEWPPGRYAFPEVYPKMPARKDYPPDQVNVDRLASFVIE